MSFLTSFSTICVVYFLSNYYAVIGYFLIKVWFLIRIQIQNHRNISFLSVDFVVSLGVQYFCGCFFGEHIWESTIFSNKNELTACQCISLCLLVFVDVLESNTIAPFSIVDMESEIYAVSCIFVGNIWKFIIRKTSVDLTLFAKLEVYFRSFKCSMWWLIFLCVEFYPQSFAHTFRWLR